MPHVAGEQPKGTSGSKAMSAAMVLRPTENIPLINRDYFTDQSKWWGPNVSPMANQER
jgi:hypothetical protein